jgi:dihydrofolate reductase
MRISMIAAMGANRVIGSRRTLPWEMPADMHYFTRTTLGHCVVMGRVSFEDILRSNGKPLAGRTNIVVTGQRGLFLASMVEKFDNVEITDSLEAALELASERTLGRDESEAFIIGGAKMFEEGLRVADRIYLTRIHAAFEGDAFFPELDATVWQEMSREDHAADAENPYPYSFTVLEHLPH